MKYYLITGASSGIGRETAKELSNEDTTVILLARRVDKLKELQQELEGESLIIECDLCDAQEIEHSFDIIRQKGIKLDGLVYCAGIYFNMPVKVMQQEDLEKMFRINVFGFFEICKLFANRMISNKGAAIVGISSYASVTRETGTSAYAMSKEAMNVQVQVLAKDFIKRKIRINTVMPAIVKSKMSSDNNDWTEEEIAEIQKKQPLGIIPISNVVAVIQFLLSDAAEFITGETVAISAGYHG